MVATKDLTFALVADRGARQALVLARSIRAFAGSAADGPILILSPGPLPSPGLVDAFAELEAEIVRLEMRPDALEFPFAAKVHAAAAAEQLAETPQLLLMDPDSLVLGEPPRLGTGLHLACRPVDHRLIGSPYDQPPDGYWQFIYESCRVPAARVFPVTTTVDGERVRAYFNAGYLLVRPGRGLFRRWRESFDQLYDSPGFGELQELQRIFLHQAVLAAAVLSVLDKAEIRELPREVNYPLHMHESYPLEFRPRSMNELISCRYDTLFADRGWQELLPAREPLRSWLAEQLTNLHGGS